MELFRGKSDYPPYLVRRRFRYAPIALIFISLILLLMVLEITGHVDSKYLGMSGMFALPFLVTMHYLGYRDKQRELARIRKIDYRVCTDCGYLLTGLGDSGACPECGKGFQLDELRKIWQRCENQIFPG